MLLAIYGILILGALFYRPNYLKIKISLTKKDLQYFVFLLCIAIVLMILFIKIGLYTFAPSYNLKNSILLVGMLLFVVAPAEEMLYRGIIQTKISRYLGIFGGLVVASIIFGLAHLPNGALGLSIELWNWRFAFASSIGGLLFGISFINSSSILAPAVLHTAISTIYSIFLH